MELLPSWTKAGYWSLGRDPLGMQATSVRLYRTLVPGLTNVTNRLRYYSFYCWVIRHYEETAHADDEARWRIFIRRAEALYALACSVVDAQQSDGLAGGIWASALRQSLPNGNIDLRPYTDQPDKGGQYLKAKRGNFGQFYVASMTEVELLRPSLRIPLVTELQGREMATAFAVAAGKSVGLLSSAITTGQVSPEDLRDIGEAVHPSRIPDESAEMKLLRSYLLATNITQGSAVARRSSAWIILDLLRCGASSEDETGFREAFYNRRAPDGSAYEVSGLTIDRWKAFQANELCHIVFEALLNALLMELQNHPFGLPPAALLTRVIEPLLARLGTGGKTWKEWASDTGTGYVGAEFSLAEPILLALRDVEQASSIDHLVCAVQLLATLWWRWGVQDHTVRDSIERHAGKGGRSLSGVLRTLDACATESVGTVLGQVARRHLIADHLAIAGRKLATSGTFTYHFTLSDGIVTDGRVTNYGYTNPRLKNLVRFLRDAQLYDGKAVTSEGARFLRENQPI